ncbi:Gfo/Idh/MocA family oxidoreductase [Streptomyces sp. NPDC002896]|uniref:Gfo/Idh/MocA family protein n=1 Tax=Streptomyces sp. NPDC002896 TaxID=3154438 RepID=UPI00333101EB
MRKHRFGELPPGVTDPLAFLWRSPLQDGPMTFEIPQRNSSLPTLRHLCETQPDRLVDDDEEATGIAFIGCGYVADFYMATLRNYPELSLRGVYDSDRERVRKFSERHGVRSYASLDELLADDSVSIAVNLTNPRSHYEVSRRCLEAGRHVYSEKPFAEDLRQATELVEFAEQTGLTLSSAPCSLLGETAQTMWRALRRDVIGQPRLVYAELDDGAVHQMNFRSWASSSGAPWPYLDEFRVGPTLEHAGYYLTWLTAFFGPASEVMSYGRLIQPDKLPDAPPSEFATDFTCACIRFHSGVVARLTCSTVAPEDHSLQIVGDDGVLSVSECWDYGAQIKVRKRTEMSESTPHYLTEPEQLPLVRPADYPFRYERYNGHDMDFSRGIADMAEAVRNGVSPRLTARHALHVLEITLAISSSEGAAHTVLQTKFDELEPMAWAAS